MAGEFQESSKSSALRSVTGSLGPGMHFATPNHLPAESDSWEENENMTTELAKAFF